MRAFIPTSLAALLFFTCSAHAEAVETASAKAGTTPLTVQSNADQADARVALESKATHVSDYGWLAEQKNRKIVEYATALPTRLPESSAR